jgi:hypothetical protein
LSNDIRQRLQIPVVNRLLVPLHWKTISKQKQVPSKKFIFKSTLMIFKDFYFSSTIPINQFFPFFSLLCLCLSTGIASPSQSPPMEKKIDKTGFSFSKNSKKFFWFFFLFLATFVTNQSPLMITIRFFFFSSSF